MSQYPPVSAVIPAFNAADHLQAAVHSALCQTIACRDVIVVDDGSTDSTGACIGTFGNRIRYFRQENLGPAAARNTGIRHANGELIAFLDADDTWTSKHLETLIPLFEDPTVGLVFADVSLRLPRRPDMASYWRDVRHVHCDGDRLELHFADIFRNNIIPTSTVILRKRLAEAAGMFDETLPYGAEDWDLWLRVSAQSRVVGLPVVLGHRLGHAGNLSGQPAQAASVLAVLRKVETQFPELTAAAGVDVPRVMARVLFEKGYRHFDRYEFGQARRHFLESLRIRFSPSAAGFLLATLMGVPVARTLRKLKRLR